MVVLRHQRAAKSGEIHRQAVEQGRLHKQGRTQRRATGVVIAADADAVALMALAQHKRNGGVGLGKLALRAVALFNDDFQIAALRRGIEIPDLERAGRDLGFIDHITMLAHRHSGVAVGNAMDNRREAALAVRQHRVVRHHLHPAKLHAVEHLAGGIGIAHAKLTAQHFNIALKISGLRLPVTGQIVTVGRGIAQTPGAEIGAAAQAQQGRLPVAALITGAGAGKGVINEGRRNALIPFSRIDIVAFFFRQGDLRNTDRQLLLRKVEPRRGVGNKVAQLLYRFALFKPVESGKRAHVNAHLRQLTHRQ